jgi:hypothetical protein
MEPKDYELVKEEIELVISELNTREILTNHDIIEIEDHFYCDVEELILGGLTTKEALLVARSRFGELNEIREDYEVVKPESNLLYFSFIAVLGFSILKGLLVLINIVSQIFWMNLSVYYPSFLEDNFWTDLPIRFMLLGAGMWILVRIIKKRPIVNFNRFWYVPLVYLSMEMFNRFLGFIVLPGVYNYTTTKELRLYGEMLQSEAIIGVFSIFLITITVSIKLYKMMKREHQYV